METRCPHCRTVFRVAEEQLAVADGIVRCGECEQVFNARDEASNTRSGDAISIDIPEVHAADIHLDSPELDIPEGFHAWPATNPVAPLADETVTDTQQADAAVPTDAPGEVAGEKDTAVTVGTAATRRNESGYDVAALYPELDKAPQMQAPPTPGATLGWSLAILIVLALLFAQLTYFMRDRLARNPNLRPVLETLCEKLDCKLSKARAPNMVRLVEHKVLSHPQAPEGLRVEAVIVNEASFDQPYPILRLRFLDLDGHLQARRDFLPVQYLPTDVDSNADMTSGDPVNAVLDIIDPGKKAISYEFDFL